MEISRIHADAAARRQAGLTLVEVLLYLTISSVLMGSMYQMTRGQQTGYSTQNALTEIQQSLRVGMYALSKDIRSAGYNPTGMAVVGFTTTFPAPNDKFTIDYATTNSIVAFLADTNGNRTIEPDSTEQIAYRHNTTNRTMERFVSTTVMPGGAWEVVIDNVDALNFVFLGDQGTPVTLAKDIRTVEIALLVRSRQPDAKLSNTEVYKNKRGTVLCPTCSGDHYHRRLLTTTAQARNCAYTGIQGLCDVAR